MKTPEEEVGPEDERSAAPSAKAIRKKGLTAYAAAKRSGVSVDAVHRFLKDERGLTLGTVDKLAGSLGLTLCEEVPSEVGEGNNWHSTGNRSATSDEGVSTTGRRRPTAYARRTMALQFGRRPIPDAHRAQPQRLYMPVALDDWAMPFVVIDSRIVLFMLTHIPQAQTPPPRTTGRHG